LRHAIFTFDDHFIDQLYWHRRAKGWIGFVPFFYSKCVFRKFWARKERKRGKGRETSNWRERETRERESESIERERETSKWKEREKEEERLARD
jgi:hypothetical protein